MKLRDYLREHDISASACARAIDRSVPVITRLLNGERKGVSLDTAIRIQRWSSGKVTVEDMLGPQAVELTVTDRPFGAPPD